MTAQQSLATDFFWFIAIGTVLFWAGVWIVKLVRTTRIEDAYPTPPPAPHTCQIGDCSKPAVAIYDKHPAGSIYVCDRHDRAVNQWVGPYGRAVPVYDQDLDGTDLQQWEAEL
jgi:hypothetical protein